MKNVTVTLLEDTAQWVRVWATEQGKSVSAALADLIEERRHDRERRERARDQFLPDFYAISTRSRSAT